MGVVGDQAVKRLVVTDPEILTPAREYVCSCLQIMGLDLAAGRIEEIVQDVAQYPARLRDARRLAASANKASRLEMAV